MFELGPKELHAFLDREFPQIAHMGTKVERLDANGIRVRIEVKKQHLRPGGTVSGPTLMALADVTGYLLVLAHKGPVAMAVTTSLNINFLRMPGAGDVIAEGRVLKMGKRLAVLEADMHPAEGGEMIAHATLTYSIPVKSK